ncbi:MAG: mechanosensitive ion channel family protein [Planctomycetota bacterium]
MEDTAATEGKEVAVEEREVPKAESKPEKPTQMGPFDELDRGVPRSSFLGFMKAAEQGDYERAADYLDMRYLPYDMDIEDGPKLARQFKIVLDRALWVDTEVLSTDPAGHGGDGLYHSRDMIGSVEIEGRKVELLLQRVPREADGVLIWKFANVTVNQIPELLEEFGFGPVGERLSKILPSGQFLGLYLWQWIMAIGILLIAYCIVYIPTKIIAVVICRRKTELSERVATFICGPVRFLMTLMIGGANVELIHPTVKARVIMNTKTLSIAICVWAAISLIGIFRDLFVIRLKQKGSETSIVLLGPIIRVVQFMVVVVGVLIWFENLGFKATTLLTGLGIGGLAIALATQKSIENLIGAITLFISAPVKIGDFGRFGDVMGTVEQIGLRYTDIRTLNRTLVHIPNAIFADMKLENFHDREKILFHPKISLSRKTTPDQIRFILVEVRKMLYSHPAVDPIPARVRFKEFGTHSLDISIFVYILRTNYSEYMEVAEDLNLRIMDIIRQAGTELAVPIQNVWFEKNRSTEKELVDAAEAQTRQWRENNELCLPKFPEEKVDELRNTLDYPPEGSAVKEVD